MSKKISIKGLADFITASPARQRSILRDYKYPAEDGGRAKILYYRDARDRIAAFHRTGKPPVWLQAEALQLEALAANSPEPAHTRLRNNARGIHAYAQHFASRTYAVRDDLVLELGYGDVIVTVRPDLFVEEKGREKIIKLEFASGEPNQRMIQIISQGMFEAARNAGLPLQGKDVLYLDVARGKEHRGARLGARLRKDIAAACANIDAIWNSI